MTVQTTISKPPTQYPLALRQPPLTNDRDEVQVIFIDRPAISQIDYLAQGIAAPPIIIEIQESTTDIV